MSGRNRALPPWMSKKEAKEAKKEPLKRRRKEKTARAVFYCMNEKELVEAAASFLTNNAASGDVEAALLSDQKVEDKAMKATRRIMKNPATSKKRPEAIQEESSDCSDAHERTYVSETDTDIREMDTVPYTGSPQQERPEEGKIQGPLQTEIKKAEHTQVPGDAAVDDDALRLVREIFFT
ncbi:uncharacterized protein si:ch211-127m7.2 [Labrus bergylta]|uniref:uncharacterized protein si:ch211-127m7.2 n=1 Tax=Labrus bergylta TaxID=56723 RepID=UPI00331319A9